MTPQPKPPAEDAVRPIPGWEDYSVSTDGRVFRDGQEMKLSPTVKGYMRFTARMNGELKSLSSHKCVALAWIGPPPQGKPYVAHLDGDPSNNHVSNLQWVSQSENEAHKKLHGTVRLGDSHQNAKLTSAKVAEARRLFSEGAAIRALARQFGVAQRTMGYVVHGVTWK